MEVLGAILVFVSLIMFVLSLVRLAKPEGVSGNLQGKTRKDALLKLLVPSIVIFFVAGAIVPQNQDGQKKVASSQKEKKDPNRRDKKSEEADQDNFLPFEYIDVNKDRDVKISIDVRVKGWGAEKLPSKEQLRATGEHIVSVHNAKNKFVTFYLPGIDPNSGGYASFSKRGDESGELDVFKRNLTAEYRDVPSNKNKGPTQYESIEEMAKNLTTWRITVLEGGNNPHIQVAAQTFETNLEYSPDLVKESVRRVLVYGAYRTFIHTNAQKVKVSALPFIRSKEDKQDLQYVERFKKTAEVSREKALRLLRNRAGVDSLSDLVGIKSGESYLRDASSPEFKKIIYNDAGAPGLDRFASLLMR